MDARDTPPSRVAWRAARTVLALVTLALTAFAGRAEAVRLVVDPAGGGDFTTVQAGLDSLARKHTIAWTGDTLVVLPGNYPESIHMDSPWLDWPNYVLCPGGRDSTRVQDVTHVYGAGARQWRIVGLSITNSVDLAYPPGEGEPTGPTAVSRAATAAMPVCTTSRGPICTTVNCTAP